MTNNNRNHILRTYTNTVVVMANLRKVPGQVLVIPKRHIERFSELNKVERDEIFEVIADTENRLVNYYNAGCEVTQRYKPYLEEDEFAVDHLHFHVLPRREDDILEEMRIKEHRVYSEVTAEEVAELSTIFK